MTDCSAIAPTCRNKKENGTQDEDMLFNESHEDFGACPSTDDLCFLTGHLRNLPPLRNLEDFTKHEVPKLPGVYLLLARPRCRFLYPKRKQRSTVFYIGQADNLWRRHKDHQKYAGHASDKHSRGLPRYNRRYEYTAMFGARYTFIKAGCRGMQRKLEQTILLLFAEKYGCCPIAN